MSEASSRSSHARSIHCSPKEQDAIRARARAAAKRRGPSIARYVVELALRDTPDPSAGPLLALDAKEQREILDAARTLSNLLAGDMDIPAFLADMAQGIDAMLLSWALDTARDGHLDEVRAVMAARHGEARAKGEVARIQALAAAPRARRRARTAAPDNGSKPGSLVD